MPDLKAGLSSIHRSLIEGGHLAAAVWALPAEDTLIATMMSTVMIYKKINQSMILYPL